MRSTLLGLTLLMGCFSVPPSSGGCIDGGVACDCKTDGTCNADLECVAAIDKCVPTGCTPGSESCTCVDDGCLTGLVCDGGVCIPPSAATTGGDPSIAESTATMGPDTTPTTVTASDPSATTMTTDDTSATDPTAMSGSVSTDPTDTSVGEAESMGSETLSVDCPACIETAAAGACAGETVACQNDANQDGCKQLQGCVNSNVVPIEECCGPADGTARDLWNALVTCAQEDACADGCGLYCT